MHLIYGYQEIIREWKPSQAPTLYKPEGNNAYWGMSELNGGFKFTAQPY